MRRRPGTTAEARRPGLGAGVVVVLLLLAVGPLGTVDAPPVAANPTYDWSAVHDRLAVATTDCASACGMVLQLTRAGATPDDPDDLLVARPYGTWSIGQVFFLASAMKWVTGVTVMTVVDDGLLSLDDTVGQWFPERAGTPLAPITVRQLLSMTSGLRDSSPCVNDPTTTLQLCAAEILDAGLLSAPGTTFRYGPLGMRVAAAIVERATGRSWNEVFDQNLAQPLGLTTLRYGDHANPRVDAGTPAMGGSSTTADYDRFLEMVHHRGVFRGTRVLSDAAIDEIETDHIGSAAIVDTPVADMEGYGLGVWTWRLDGHGHAGLVMSPGAFGTHPWVDRARGERGVLAMSSSFAKGRAVHADLLPLIEAQLDAVPAGTPGQVAPTVTALTPAKGPTAGGQVVTITGTGLASTTEVRFSSSLVAPSFTVVRDTELRVTSPPRAAGVVNVRVTNGAGISTTSAATQYQYVAAPTISAVSPTSSSALGGATITITGTNLGLVSGVRFGPDTWATSFTMVSSTKVTAVVPPRAPGLVNVFVRTPGGLSATSAATLFVLRS